VLLVNGLAWVASGLMVLIGGLAVLLYIQQSDPMLLIFGIIAAGLVGLVFVLSQFLQRKACAACHASNSSGAKFCAQCAKPL
jgi:hypothetical protein